jgi:hypothetical protein
MSEFIEDSTEIKCTICFEKIGEKNNTTTPCGHIFCFECITRSMQTNNTCPYCRAVLIELKEDKNDEGEDDDDYESYEEDSDNEEDDESNIDDYDQECGDLEKIILLFEDKGYDLKDAMTLLLNRKSKTDTKYTNEYIKKLEDDFELICDSIDEEYFAMKEEQENFAKEDIRSIQNESLQNESLQDSSKDDHI